MQILKDERLENYKLEIRILQQKDQETAIDNGFTNKSDWFKYICQQDYDEIAEAIISIAERYEVPLERVAHDFDSTMVVRLGRIKNREQKESRAKAA